MTPEQAIAVAEYERRIALALDDIERARSRRKRKRASERPRAVLHIACPTPRTPGVRDTLTDAIAMSGDNERVFSLARPHSLFAERAEYQLRRERRDVTVYRWLRGQGLSPQAARERVRWAQLKGRISGS